MHIARVALDVPLRRLFDYIIPEQYISDTHVGSRVKVPFAQYSKVGIIVEKSTSSDFDLKKLKPITTLVDTTPLFNKHDLALLAWLGHYYLCPPSETYINLLPKQIKGGCEQTLAPEIVWTANTQQAHTISSKAKKQQAIYNFIKEHAFVTKAQLKEHNYTPSNLKTLLELKAIEAIENHSTKVDYKSVKFVPAEYALNDEQATAVSQITAAADQFKAILLEGVTGSGKTEVYIQAMAQALADKKQVLVLVPEIGLTPQTLQRFKARFDTDIDVLHSELNDTERKVAWLKSRNGQARIVIGTRSAVLVPMPDLGLIIMDEEHDLSFKQQDSLRYHARDVAIKRAHLLSIPIVMGTATPTLETLKNAKEGRYLHLKLTQRATTSKLPAPFALDIKDQPIQAGLAPRVVELIGQHLTAGNQVLIFLNRRGFSPALICHECGWVYQCQRCDQHYTYHKTINQLHCHHCGDVSAVPRQCHDCGSTQIIDWGVGTEKLEHFLVERFQEYSILRVDRDSVRGKGALERKLDEVKDGQHQLLIGTQMLAKGHHFPNLTLTVIVNLDNALFSSDFRATERMSQVLLQVAGRAGRGDKPGQVILQTHHPEHPILQLLTQHKYADVQNLLLTERQEMALPPFQYWALIRVECHQKDKVHAFCQHTKALAEYYIAHHYSDVIQLPPMPATQEKRAGKYRYLIIFESKNRKHLNSLLLQLSIQLEQNKDFHQVRWTIDIDPQDIS